MTSVYSLTKLRIPNIQPDFISLCQDALKNKKNPSLGIEAASFLYTISNYAYKCLGACQRRLAQLINSMVLAD